MHEKVVLSGPIFVLRSRFGDIETICRMARAGFDAIDYTFNEMTNPECIWNTDEWEEYAKRLLDVAHLEGVYFNQAHAPFLFDWDGMWLTPEFESYILKVIEHSIRCAAALKIPVIIVHPIHHIRYRGNEALLWEWNQTYYKRILACGERYGIKIALENMWQLDPNRECSDADVFSSSEEYCSFLDSLQSPWATACVDLGHVGLAGEDPTEMLRVLGGKRVTSLHVHDNGHKNDDHTLPYLGKLDWEAITRTLGEIDYQGGFTFEVGTSFYAFDDELIDDALRFQVAVGRHLIQKIQKYKQND